MSSNFKQYYLEDGQLSSRALATYEPLRTELMAPHTDLCFPALPRSCQRLFLVSSWSTERVPQDSAKNLASDYNTQVLIWYILPIFFHGNCKMETDKYKKYWLGDSEDFRHDMRPSDMIIHLCSV